VGITIIIIIITLLTSVVYCNGKYQLISIILWYLFFFVTNLKHFRSANYFQTT